jgi:hypothetical protein
MISYEDGNFEREAGHIINYANFRLQFEQTFNLYDHNKSY